MPTGYLHHRLSGDDWAVIDLCLTLFASVCAAVGVPQNSRELVGSWLSCFCSVDSQLFSTHRSRGVRGAYRKSFQEPARPKACTTNFGRSDCVGRTLFLCRLLLVYAIDRVTGIPTQLRADFFALEDKSSALQIVVRDLAFDDGRSAGVVGFGHAQYQTDSAQFRFWDSFGRTRLARRLKERTGPSRQPF